MNQTIKLVSKQNSFWMKLIGILSPDFMLSYWTTVGNTIYYPIEVIDPGDKQWRMVIEHECVHIKQYEKYGKFLFLFLYVFIPLPMFFSYFRWKFEREAYMTEIKNEIDVDIVVESLYSGYVFPWPKRWMKEWFERELAK